MVRRRRLVCGSLSLRYITETTPRDVWSSRWSSPASIEAPRSRLVCRERHTSERSTEQLLEDPYQDPEGPPRWPSRRA